MRPSFLVSISEILDHPDAGVALQFYFSQWARRRFTTWVR